MNIKKIRLQKELLRYKEKCIVLEFENMLLKETQEILKAKLREIWAEGKEGKE